MCFIFYTKNIKIYFTLRFDLFLKVFKDVYSFIKTVFYISTISNTTKFDTELCNRLTQNQSGETRKENVIS